MKANATTKSITIVEKSDVLIAIGSAIAANCIPCFEHLYEKAVTTGITPGEIKKAAEIAGMIKKGAHVALSNSIDELIGSKDVNGSACEKKTVVPCSC